MKITTLMVLLITSQKSFMDIASQWNGDDIKDEEKYKIATEIADKIGEVIKLVEEFEQL